ncbi:MAG: hypothetical protein KF915_07475 [Polyangiaceae bacterium]|nr:hypothetical protein [Polyangiaceae bacterium]
MTERKHSGDTIEPWLLGGDPQAKGVLGELTGDPDDQGAVAPRRDRTERQLEPPFALEGVLKGKREPTAPVVAAMRKQRWVTLPKLEPGASPAGGASTPEADVVIVRGETSSAALPEVDTSAEASSADELAAADVNAAQAAAAAGDVGEVTQAEASGEAGDEPSSEAARGVLGAVGVQDAGRSEGESSRNAVTIPSTARLKAQAVGSVAATATSAATSKPDKAAIAASDLEAGDAAPSERAPAASAASASDAAASERTPSAFVPSSVATPHAEAESKRSKLRALWVVPLLFGVLGLGVWIGQQRGAGVEASTTPATLTNAPGQAATGEPEPGEKAPAATGEPAPDEPAAAPGEPGAPVPTAAAEPSAGPSETNAAAQPAPAAAPTPKPVAQPAAAAAPKAQPAPRAKPASKPAHPKPAAKGSGEGLLSEDY